MLQIRDEQPKTAGQKCAKSTPGRQHFKEDQPTTPLWRNMLASRKLSLSFILFAIIATLFAPALYAQDATAKILGQVVDPQGSIVPEAAITVTNVDTNVTNTAKTDKNGSFQVNQLPIGKYKVSADKEGFAIAT